MATTSSSPPGAFKGLLSNKMPFNPAMHTMGPSPMMHDHISVAMQRPWSQTPTKPKAPGFAQEASETASNGASDMGQGQAKVEPMKQFIIEEQGNAHTSPAPKLVGKENVGSVGHAEEEPWWDILPKLGLCAINQFGCCQGQHGDTSLTRRKPLCGVGIVFAEANHGALVVQQVVSG